MSMPAEVNLRNITEAIKDATILTDNNVKEQLFTSEVSDCINEVPLYPGSDRMTIKNDDINGPIPLLDYSATQLMLEKELDI